MRGVLSRWSRYARVLPPTALALGSLAVVACGGSAGKTSTTPPPKDKAPPKEVASAQPKKPAKSDKSTPPKTDTTQKPDTAKKAEPAAPPAPPPPPPPPDSTAIAADFCKKVNDGVKKAIDADSSLKDVDEAVRKASSGIPDETTSVALSRNTTCH